jgi:hypothetical protein
MSSAVSTIQPTSTMNRISRTCLAFAAWTVVSGATEAATLSAATMKAMRVGRRVRTARADQKASLASERRMIRTRAKCTISATNTATTIRPRLTAQGGAQARRSARSVSQGGEADMPPQRAGWPAAPRFRLA